MIKLIRYFGIIKYFGKYFGVRPIVRSILMLILILILMLLFTLPACVPVNAQTWNPLGPPGGDVRSLATDPSNPGRIFLGTVDGHIFGSVDAGEHWKLLGRAGMRQDNVVTSIVVDPRDSKVLYV